VVAVTDSTGAVVERYQYGDYGDRRVFDAAGNTREYSLIGLRHGFTGQLHDDESGLVLMRHRHLNPRDGKWLQRDPAWYVDGAGLAQYARSSPTGNADPFGLQLTSHGEDWRFDPRPPGFVYHGNWGGPGWANGQHRPESGPLPRPGDPGYLGPTDMEDTCYREHDYCISDSVNCKENAVSIEACDFRLADCLSSVFTRSVLANVRIEITSILFRTVIPFVVHGPRPPLDTPTYLCLFDGEQVLLEDGTVASVNDLANGSLLISTGEEVRSVVVTGIRWGESNSVLRLHVRHGELRVTDRHPVMMCDGSFVEAALLEAGQCVMTVFGPEAITSVCREQLVKPSPVAAVSVSDPSTYVAWPSGIVVHNK
jgi:RHS repeat-associated protein